MKYCIRDEYKNEDKRGGGLKKNLNFFKQRYIEDIPGYIFRLTQETKLGSTNPIEHHSVKLPSAPVKIKLSIWKSEKPHVDAVETGT